MKVTNLKIHGVVLLEPDIHKDDEGWFFESYNTVDYSKYGINSIFVQENHSISKRKGTLRGLHFQNNPNSQAKLATVTKGSSKQKSSTSFPISAMGSVPQLKNGSEFNK